ncbi:MAG: hypothetical protein H6721_28165 [Sandaracinus sp.]|nr:hypothetical protein [Sandaracinus sp.]MCB9636004.1 hypothetical protein [Sandaracinus sp.]
MKRLVLLTLVLSACASPGRRATVDLVPFFEAEGVAEARRDAPDLVAAADLAREDAERAAEEGDGKAADDHATRARLWLDAALVEAERIRLDRERRAILEEAEAAAAEADALEAERVAIAARARHEAAAEVARVQMQAAFAAAERLEERGRRHRGPDVDRTRRDAAIALEARTQLLVAAARALGATDEELAPLEATPTPPTDPAARLAAADARHREASAVLGRRRATLPVGPEAVASLVEAAREHGLEPVMTPEGLVLPGASDHVLVDLATAFPHGPVVLRGRGAAARARRLASELSTERIQADERVGAEDAVFPAYVAQ